MKTKVSTIATAGILTALTFLLGMTPLGIIPLGFINVTIMCLPVIIGTLTVGPKIGGILGLCFGIASTLSAFGLSLVPTSGLVSTLMGASPLLVVVMSILPRAIIPLVAYSVYQVVSRRGQMRRRLAIGLASAAGSLTNTILYLGMMLLFFALTGLDSTAVLGVIGGTGLIAGSLEAVASVLICLPVVLAVRKKPAFEKMSGQVS